MCRIEETWSEANNCHNLWLSMVYTSPAIWLCWDNSKLPQLPISHPSTRQFEPRGGGIWTTFPELLEDGFPIISISYIKLQYLLPYNQCATLINPVSIASYISYISPLSFGHCSTNISAQILRCSRRGCRAGRRTLRHGDGCWLKWFASLINFIVCLGRMV